MKRLRYHFSSSATRLLGCILSLAIAGGTTYGNVIHDDDNLLAYEGFDYEPGGNLTGGTLSGGTGWTGAWNVTHEQSQGLFAPIEAGSLQYVDQDGYVLYTTGNHAYLQGGVHNDIDPSIPPGNLFVARTLEQELSGDVGAVYYISFLAQEVGPELDPESDFWDDFEGGYPWGDSLYPRNNGVRLLGSPDTTQFGGNSFNALIGKGSYHTERDPQSDWKFISERSRAFSGVLMHPQVSLVVARIERNVVDGVDDEGDPVSGDRVTLWVNPSLTDEIDEDGITIDIMEGDSDPVEGHQYPYHIPIGRIGAEAGNGNSDNSRPEAHLTLDEIRVGTTYASVTPHLSEAAETWNEYTINPEGWVNTGDWLGWLYVPHDPWVYSPGIGWTFMPEVHETGAWMFSPKED